MLGENIQCLRKKKSLSRLKLANLCNLDDAGIYRIEVGISKNPSINTIAQIAKVLEVSIDELLHEDFKKKVQKN